MAVEIPVVIDIDGAFQEAAKRVKVAMEPLQKQIDNLTSDLTFWKEILNSSDIKGDEWLVAAKNIQNISEALSQADYELRRYTSNDGSIREMSTDLAELNRRWEAMGTAQKFKADGSYSDDAVEAFNQYKQITAELERQGKTLAQLAREERQRAEDAARLEQKKNQYRQQGIQKRQYENAILNSTVKTMRVLTEQERILSKRLSQTPVGTDKYNKLKLELQAVRREIEKIDGTKFRTLGDEIGKSNSKLASLIKNSIRLIALHSSARFIQNIREVTSEFELQRVALGSIIQDTQRAENLFKQIKAAAIQSPFEIKDLVSYTKQLSAYQIETDKLFDTTMRLADISAGLGVDMGRLILAFGQVRAAAVLRGQELRQFTEAGIPLVDKLAEKFSELNGRAVSTAEVFELISKRAVPFSMIEDIFKDLTSAGGAFYQMQEKQAETLLGQWNNLKDAVSIMYDEIGNTTVVHNAMESMIKGLRTLMLNWRTLAEIVKAFGTSFIIVKTASLFLPVLTRNTQLAQRATEALARAEELEAITSTKGARARQRAISSLTLYATYTKKAAEATTLLGRGWNNLLAYLAKGGGISIAIGLLTALSGVLISVWKESRRLDKELNEIGAKGSIEITQAVRTFERLAETATNAADGSKEQRDALDELKRTFGDISPALDGHIESLRALEGSYASVTNAIREKINWQIREQKITTITQDYQKQLGNQIDDVKDVLSELQFTRAEISSITNAIQNAASQGIINAASSIEERAKVIEDIIYQFTGRIVKISKRASYGGYATWTEYAGELGRALGSLADTSIKMESQIQAVMDDTQRDVSSLGTYAKVIEGIEKEIEKIDLKEGDKVLDPKSYAGAEMKGRETVKIFAKAIQDEFAKTKIDISSAFAPSGQIDFSVLQAAAKQAAQITVKEINETTKEEVERTPFTAITGFVSELQKRYENIIPSDKIALVTKRKLEEIASTVGVSMENLRQHIKQSGVDDADYMKGLSEAIDAYTASVKKMVSVNAALAAGTAQKDTKPYSREEIDEAQKMAQALEMLSSFMSQIITVNKKSKGGDTRLSDLKKDIGDITNAYKKFIELQEYMSKEKALFNINEMFPTLEGWEPTYENMLDRLNNMLIDIQAKRAKSPKDSVLLDMERAIRAEIANIKFDHIKSDLDAAIKKLTDEMKRSETVRDFYQSILGLTGDTDLATSLSISVYGGIGEDFKDRMQAQLDRALSALDPSAVTDTLREAFAKQNFEVILQNLQLFPEEWQKVLKEMAADSEKFYASQATDLLKALEKARTYSEKRGDLARQTALRNAQIDQMKVSEDVKKEFRKRNAKKDADDAAKLAYEAFKDTPMYVELFANLDAASTRMLKSMRDNLEAVKSQWKNLDPTELKELQSRIQEVDKQLATKNPFAALRDSIKEYRELVQTQSREEADIAAVSANERLNSARQELELRIKQYNAISAATGEESEMAKQADKRVKEQQKIVDEAEEEAKAAQKIANQFRSVAARIQGAAEALNDFNGYLSEALGGVGEIVETLGSADAADTFSILSEGLTKTLGGIANIGTGIGTMLTNPIAGAAKIISGIGSVIGGIFGTANALKMKRINNEIEEQDDILHNLEKSYDALEKAIAGAFGSDYVYNYTEQLKNLEAQQAAYLKQAELEREKGKKADEEKIKEYTQSAEEAGEKIMDMQGQLAEHFAGTDVTSAARDFANAWIDAYRTFGSTTNAMKEKFREMIDSMVTESLAAQLIKNILEPIFQDMEEYAKTGGELDETEIADIANKTVLATQQIDEAMTALMQRLAAAGINMRDTAGGFSGIARDIAGASEQDINGLAAGINTQNFYMSYVPTISADVAAIRAAITGTTTPTVNSATGEEPQFGDELFRGQMSRIDANLADLKSMMASVITLPGTRTNSKVIAVQQ